MNQLIVDTLVRAKARIADSHDWWGAGNPAPSASGKTQLDDPRWCAVESLSLTLCHSITPQGEAEMRQRRLVCEGYLNAAAVSLYGVRSIIHINDKVGHHAVMKCYDAAIEAAQKDALVEVPVREGELATAGD